jgi:hypothetical protein
VGEGGQAGKARDGEPFGGDLKARVGQDRNPGDGGPERELSHHAFLAAYFCRPTTTAAATAAIQARDLIEGIAGDSLGRAAEVNRARRLRPSQTYVPKVL